MKLSILLFLTLASLALAGKHKCIHNELKTDIFIADFPEEDLRDSADRKLVTYAPIRIVVDYTNMKSGSAAIREYIQYELVPNVLEFYEASLKVIPLTSNISFTDSCGGLSPSAAIQSGVEGDLAILVTTGYSSQSYIAYALPCAITNPTHRPVYGMININLNYLSIATITDKQDNFLTVLHEVVHILGFSSNLYGYYIDPSTGASINPIGTKNWNGLTINYLDVEPLTTKLRDYFGCQSLEGGYLENQGGSGSAGSHWERQTFFNEYMTASAITDSVVTEFTFALLEGTGWYQADYSYAEPFLWGKGKTCSFVNDLCMSNLTPLTTPEFCPLLQAEGCTFTGRSVALCGTNKANRAGTPSSSVFNYWSNNTVVLDTFANNCPYFMGYSNYDCAEPTFQSNGDLSQEVFGSGSRCLTGTLSNSGTAAATTGFCFPIQCTASGSLYTLTVTVGSQTYPCTSAGPISISGLSGQLNCPDPTEYCEKATPSRCFRGCSGRGTCNTNVCSCPDGWTGIDCGVRTAVDGCSRCSSETNTTTCYGNECVCPSSATTCSSSLYLGGVAQASGTIIAYSSGAFELFQITLLGFLAIIGSLLL